MFNKRIRAWHKDTKKMYKIASLDFVHDLVGLERFIGTDDNTLHGAVINISEVILMQESGLEDDAGFYVFEADVIEFEGEVFILNYGHYGDACTKVNGYGWFLSGKKHTFTYQGGGIKVGTYFENPELVGLKNGH